MNGGNRMDLDDLMAAAFGADRPATNAELQNELVRLAEKVNELCAAHNALVEGIKSDLWPRVRAIEERP